MCKDGLREFKSESTARQCFVYVSYMLACMCAQINDIEQINRLFGKEKKNGQ